MVLFYAPVLLHTIRLSTFPDGNISWVMIHIHGGATVKVDTTDLPLMIVLEILHLKKERDELFNFLEAYDG